MNEYCKFNIYILRTGQHITPKEILRTYYRIIIRVLKYYNNINLVNFQALIYLTYSLV